MLSAAPRPRREGESEKPCRATGTSMSRQAAGLGPSSYSPGAKARGQRPWSQAPHGWVPTANGSREENAAPVGSSNS